MALVLYFGLKPIHLWFRRSIVGWMESLSHVLPLCVEMTARIRFIVNHIDVLSSTPAHSLSSSQSSRIGVFEGLKYLSISCLELFESKISPLALGTVASPNSQFALETATSNLSRWRLCKTPEVTPNHISESWLRLEHISTLNKSSAWK